MNWRPVLFWVLLPAALITGWSVWREHAKAPEASSHDDGVDYTLRDFEMIALDKDSGQESLTLRAPEMHRNRADQISHITTPLFLMPDSQGQAWTLRAKTGVLNADASKLRLQTDVMGDSPTTGNIPVTTFRTSQLDVLTQSSQARTDKAVSMTRPGIIQTGVGFQLDMKTRQYQILSKVRTRYEHNAAK